MKLALSVIVLIFFCVGIVLFFPIIKSEIKYSFDKSLGVHYIAGQTETLNSFEKPLPIPNIDSSILIPTIGIAKEVKNMPNPFDSQNIILSFDDEFYLISKLHGGDKIQLYYQGRLITYEVGGEGLTIESNFLPEPFTQTISVRAKKLLTND